MKTATDHTIRAKLLLEAGRDFDIRKAHVHATLALAAEQHTANLIAIYGATAEVESGYTSAGVDYGQLAAEIREGLGLS